LGGGAPIPGFGGLGTNGLRRFFWDYRVGVSSQESLLGSPFWGERGGAPFGGGRGPLNKEEEKRLWGEKDTSTKRKRRHHMWGGTHTT